jgi:hypothetical protein
VNNRFNLNRRTLLRGIMAGTAVSVALPPLEAFMNLNGTAYAQDSGFPNRFCLFSWGNGVHPDLWIPDESGTDWALSPQLMPLSPHKEYLSVMTGFEVKAPNNDAHVSGPCGLLSGRPLSNAGGFSFTGPTVDQMIANEIGGDTQFKSIELAVEQGARGLSFNGLNSRNPPESDPKELFTRLFGPTFRAPGDEPILDPKLALRRSVLDAVMGDAAKLSQRLGQVDQRRLDQHLTAIRELEIRIGRLEEDPPNLAACVRPQEPLPLPDVDGRPQMAARAAVMNELSTMAFACDLTRVISYWYSDELSDALYFDAPAGHHQLTHDEPGDMPTVNRITTAIMSDFSDYLGRLRAIPEGDGNLLDHMALMATTDVSYARTHQIDEYPILVAGKASGALNSGVHYRSATKENACMVPLTVIRALGIAMEQYGEGPDETGQSVTALENT